MVSDVVRVDVVIPVFNEEEALEKSITLLREYLRDCCSYDWHIVIADNASTDRTPEIARQLQTRWPDQVHYFHIPQKGRGRAFVHIAKTAWEDVQGLLRVRFKKLLWV